MATTVCTDALTYLEYCQLTGTAPDDTTEVQVMALIAATTRNLELVLNCYFVQRDYVEEHLRPYTPFLWPRLSWDPLPTQWNLVLKKRPVQAVSEVKDFGGTVIPSTAYQLISDYAILHHLQGWPEPVSGWRLSLTGGWFADTAAVTLDVKLAISTIVQGQLGTGGGTPASAQPISSEQVGPVRVTYATPSMSTTPAPAPNFEALSPQVQAWLWPYLNLGGLGW